MRVGVLGLSHDHVWANLAALATGTLGRLVAAAEPDPRLRERLARTHGGVKVHATCDELLDRAHLDVVLVFADNRTSAELAVGALSRGLAVMVEKPMAADLAGAEALFAAARAAGAPLDDQLAKRVPPRGASRARSRAGGSRRRAGPGQPPRRPRRPPRVRLLAPVLSD